jgi:hypothetical protein
LDAFPAERLLVEMGFISDTSRSIAFKPSGERYQTLLSQFDRGVKKVG